MDNKQQIALQLLLLNAFILEASEQMVLLDQAINKIPANWDAARRIAHNLKGSSRAVGIRAAERSAMQLEYMFRDFQEQDECKADCLEKAKILVSHIRYWSGENNARDLFSKEPVCLMWNCDENQNAIYQLLLQREGYQVTPSTSLENLKNSMQSHHPAVLMVVAEKNEARMEEVLDLIASDEEWQHAPVILFAASDANLPAQLEIFYSGDSIAPGALMAGLEDTREASL